MARKPAKQPNNNNNNLILLLCLLQYTDWDHLGDGYKNQRMIAEVVGDYFFICPTNLFAEHLAMHGTRVYYYYFTQVSTPLACYIQYIQ